VKVSVCLDLRNVSFCRRLHAASILLSQNFNAFAIPLRIYPEINNDEWWEFDDVHRSCHQTFVYLRILVGKILFLETIVDESLTFSHALGNHGAIESLDTVKELVDMSVALIRSKPNAEECLCPTCLRGMNRDILFVP